MNNSLYSPQPPQDNPLAIASLVCGILAWLILPLLGALAEIITGHIALKKISQNPGRFKGRGMATSGLILGYGQFALLVVTIVLLILLVPVMSSTLSHFGTSLLP